MDEVGDESLVVEVIPSVHSLLGGIDVSRYFISTQHFYVLNQLRLYSRCYYNEILINLTPLHNHEHVVTKEKQTPLMRYT
jgi:hypothetical protein